MTDTLNATKSTALRRKKLCLVSALETKDNCSIHTQQRPEEIFHNLFQQMYKLCQQHGWGDPFSYSRSREIHMANHLGHSISKDYRGSDATDAAGDPVEYKSTIGKKINATYNGISVHPSWSEQEVYLRTQKIGKYKWHYYARYHEGQIQEIWKMTGEKVLNILLPKLHKKYISKQNRKDPRLGVSMNTKEITQFAERLL